MSVPEAEVREDDRGCLDGEMVKCACCNASKGSTIAVISEEQIQLR
jgi:hypothetical protein